MFAIDFDGTIADTNTLKSHWIQEHLGIQLPPHACDRTTCVSRIGTEHYARMSAEVYAADQTFKAIPVPGLQQAMSALRNHGDIFVITARDQEELPAVSAWLSKHKLDHYINSILSSEESSKIIIAGSLECEVLIDDDIRHLESDSSACILKILLKVGLLEDIAIPPHVELVTSWRHAAERALTFHRNGCFKP